VQAATKPREASAEIFNTFSTVRTNVQCSKSTLFESSIATYSFNGTEAIELATNAHNMVPSDRIGLSQLALEEQLKHKRALGMFRMRPGLSDEYFCVYESRLSSYSCSIKVS